MKIIAVYVIRKSPLPSIPLSSYADLSDFGFFQKTSAGEFLQFFAQTLAERTEENVKQSVEEQARRGNVFAENGISIVIVTDLEYPARVAFTLISKLMGEFKAKFKPDQWNTALQNSLNFPELKLLMAKYQNPHEADSLMKVQKELGETKVILHQTMEGLLTRGEKLDDLVEKSNHLGEQSKNFYKIAKKTNSCCSIQ